MTPEQLAAIERLRELELEAISMSVFDENQEYETGLLQKAEAYGMRKITEKALPLIEALAAENERLRAELDEKLDKEIDFIADCEFAIEKIGKERNALQARIDGALGVLQGFTPTELGRKLAIDEAIEILKGESRG
jgi:hypothetical protein